MVRRNGDWSFSNEVWSIKYTKDTDSLSVSAEGTEDEIFCFDVQIKTMAVKKKISKMWSKVGL